MYYNTIRLTKVLLVCLQGLFIYFFIVTCAIMLLFKPNKESNFYCSLIWAGLDEEAHWFVCKNGFKSRLESLMHESPQDLGFDVFHGRDHDNYSGVSSLWDKNIIPQFLIRGTDGSIACYLTYSESPLARPCSETISNDNSIYEPDFIFQHVSVFFCYWIFPMLKCRIQERNPVIR